jgi:tRNA1Val (adenine37-N6)-methyltransferase
LSLGISPTITSDTGAPIACSCDALLGGYISLWQPQKGYRVSSDAVLLAACAPLAAGWRVADFGTGYGQVALCLLARCPQLAGVVGFEKNSSAAQLARHNAQHNGMADRLEIAEGDLTQLAQKGDYFGQFDLAVSNPPYRLAAGHTISQDPIKADATVELTPFTDWAKAMAQSLKPQGEAVIIHEARRQLELSRALHQAGLTDQQLLPLAAYEDEAPTRVLIRARFGAVHTEHLPVMVLHSRDQAQRWLPEVKQVMEQPLAWQVWPDWQS